MIQFIVHDEGDSVGVVTVEGLKANDTLKGWIMDQDVLIDIKINQDIPIGHKLAIKDLDEEQFVDFDKTVSVLLSSKARSDEDEPAPEAPAEEAAPAETPAEEAPAPADAPAEEPAPAEASASVVKEVVEQAVDNAKGEIVNIPSSAPAEDPTIFEKYGKAFAMDQFDINCKF